MKMVEEAIDIKELIKIGEEGFGDLVKGVVDIEKETMAIGGELHADEEAILLSSGSKQENLWGINLYPQKKDEEFIEFDSVINLKPSQGNRSRGIENPQIQKRIKEIVERLIKT
ncbi:MAG: hypothetical protein COZ69_08095 [Deltaproteobacteria bacterium CG_4_8_14_3_um_filter_45_9]|nr:MAG: hypothetical protein COS40_05220 [Deltaproteobacteria bacterium CG03_land_8_20_14_0_80_45_14]PIX23608.1 MAG: hypothetical protein COZ69_08095 [Deltaproteobacteria bacterium CG_4_8_14_3_um_filter_45_9]